MTSKTIDLTKNVDNTYEKQTFDFNRIEYIELSMFCLVVGVVLVIAVWKLAGV